MSATTAAAPPQPLPRDRVLVAFSGLVLVMLLAALDSTIVATALPTIVGELGGLEHLAWVVTAYLLAQTIVTPLYGKLGDLYGRKKILQSAIVLFLGGSALCGLSHSMMQLILFRFVQGLGGGGLTVTTQAVVGDIVTPRERGRYQGIFGAVFGVASIAGPLLGGYFTTHLSWRWIFYINLPFGIAALVVLAATLPTHLLGARRTIDYVGTALLAVVLSAVTLVSDLGGTTYPWTSAPSLALIAAAVLALIVFVVVERRAAEPVLPLRLFGNRAFTVTSIVGFIVGFSLFGAVTYLPVFLQVVRGMSPTGSGLEMIPMMGGMLVTSISSGLLISRTGRYKLFPIVGTAISALGLWLLSRMNPGTSLAAAALMMLVLGLGLGLVMQVLVIAVQNAVEYRDLGVATSGAMLFRLIGGSLGTAVLGAIFASRLEGNLARMLPGGLAGTPGAGLGVGMSPAALAAMPPAVRAAFSSAFTASLSSVFIVATAVAVLGFVFTWLLPEEPLRDTVAAAARNAGVDAGEAFPMPTDPEASTELLRGLAVIADRDLQRRYMEQIVRLAGVDLIPAAAWLLIHLEREPSCDPVALGRQFHVPADRMHAALAQLCERDLVREVRPSDGHAAEFEVTPSGCAVLGKLAAARRERLTTLFAGWRPEQQAMLGEALQRLARELVPEPKVER